MFRQGSISWTKSYVLVISLAVSFVLLIDLSSIFFKALDAQ